MNVITLVFLIASTLQGFATKKYIVHQEDSVLRIACMNDDDCKADAPGTHCLANQCKCNQASGCRQPEESRGVRKIGEDCRRSSDCVIRNSWCDLGDKCACQNGTIASENGKDCLLAVTSLGQPCEDNIQCSSAIPSTECFNGTCSCLRGMRSISGVCFYMKGLGETCESDEQCLNVKHALCTRGRCACVKKYVAGSSACLDVTSSISGPCSEDVQCRESLGRGAECVGGFCDCKELYQHKFSTNKCVRDRLLGEECEDHEDCHQPGGDPSRLECVLGECKCREPYNQIQGYCVEGASDTPNALPSFLNIVIAALVILCVYF